MRPEYVDTESANSRREKKIKRRDSLSTVKNSSGCGWLTAAIPLVGIRSNNGGGMEAAGIHDS